MKVPVQRQPQTRVSTRQLGLQRAAPGLDITPITRVLDNVRAKMEADNKDRQQFEIRRRMLQEVNELQTDFAGRQRDPNASPYTFAETVNTDYQARHEAILNDLYEQGFDQGLLEDMAIRLGDVRTQYVGQGLAHQAQVLTSRAIADGDQLGLAASQYVTANPLAIASAEQELHDAFFSNPDLTEPQAQALYDRHVAVLRQGASKAYALANPEDTIRLLDPNGLTAPRAAQAAGGGAYENITGWQGVATNVASALGLDAKEVAAVMSFESAGTFDPTKMGGDGGNYMGLIQFGPNERQQYGIDADSTPEEWTNAILSFMDDRGFEKGMGLEDFYSTILTGSPGNYDRQDSNGTSVRNAIPRILADHGPNAERWLAAGIQSIDPDTGEPSGPIIGGNLPTNVTQQVDNGDGTVSTVRTISIGTDKGEVLIPTVIDGRVVSDEEAIAHYNETGENFGTFATSEDADAYAEQLHQAHARELGIQAETGNPVIDRLSGPERLQMLGWAREQMNRTEVNMKGSLDVAIANAVASVGDPRGYQGPTITLEQAVSVYGPLEGPQKFAQYEQALETNKVVQAITTLPADQIAARVESLRPDPGSPTYAVENQMYEAAVRAQATVLAQRKEDPAAYVFSSFPDIANGLAQAQTTVERKNAFSQMDRAYEQLGVPQNERVGLSKELLEQLGHQYVTASAQGKTEIIENLMDEMGPTMAGTTLGSIKGNPVADDVRLYAMIAATANSRSLFMDVLRGKEAIAQDPARKPTQDVVNASYRNGIGTAINNLGPDMSRTVNAAAAALYVQRGGSVVREGGTQGLPDTELYLQALRDVLGGSASNKDSGIVDMSDSSNVTDQTILPNGVTGRQFRAWQDGLTMPRLQRINPLHDVPRDRNMRPLSIQNIVDEGVFVMRAPGIYGIKLTSDGGWVLDKTGQRYTVQLELRPKK